MLFSIGQIGSRAFKRRELLIIPRQIPSLFLFVLAATTTSTTSLAWNIYNQSSPNTSPSTHQRRFLSMSSGSTWNENAKDRQQAMKKCVIPLSATSYKGSSGRIGVLGGSARYTGAPYYAAMASLKVGADLAFVFCAQEASVPIKCYSPELMVAPVYSAAEFDRLVQSNQESSEEAERLVEKMVQEVTSMMDKLHALVIGPGLGRCPLVLEATSRIIQQSQKYKVPLVLDADALYLLTLEPYQQLLKQISHPVVLTPNAMERKRLQGTSCCLENGGVCLNNVIVVEKGQCDVIQYHDYGENTRNSIICGEIGGLKRSGGLGDLLAGSLGTFVAWNGILTKQGVATLEGLPLGCWTACCLVKISTKQAFSRQGRSMTAPDVLNTLGPTMDKMTSMVAEAEYTESKL